MTLQDFLANKLNSLYGVILSSQVNPFSNCTRAQSEQLAYISLNPLLSPLTGKPNIIDLKDDTKILQDFAPHTCIHKNGPDLIPHCLEDVTKSNGGPLSTFRVKLGKENAPQVLIKCVWNGKGKGWGQRAS